MNNKRIILFLTLFFLFHSTFASQVTLEQAKKFAIDNNFKIKALKNSVKAADSSIEVARSNFMPKVGVAAGGETESEGTTRESAALGYAYANLNVFNGLSDQAALVIAKTKFEEAEKLLSQNILKLEIEIETLFYRYIFMREQFNTLNKSLKLNDVHQKLVKKQKASGIATDSDVMEFSLNDALLKSELVSIEQELNEIKLELTRLLGPEIGPAFEPIGKIPHFHINEKLSDLFTMMQNGSLGVAISSLKLKEAKYKERVYRAEWLPKIDLELKAGYLPIDERPTNNRASFSGAILAKWEFFSGFGTKARTNRATYERMKQEYELKHDVLDSMTSVERFYKNLLSIEKRVDLEEKNEDKAQRLYKSILSEYKRGVKTSGDVRGAEETLRDAVLRFEKFKLDYILSKLKLESVLSKRLKMIRYDHGHK